MNAPAAPVPREPDAVGRLAGVHVYPVKSCGEAARAEGLLIETGLDLDRAWMVVSPDGEMLTQRDEPRMALVRTEFRAGELMLRAPGMLALHLKLDTVEGPSRVKVWNDEVDAFDMGALAAQWFTDLLGRPLRLARFDPEKQRLASREWTGEVEARIEFADAYPLLVTNAASLAAFNVGLAARGQAAVTMQRFRPNLVLEGFEAWDEDHIDELAIDAEGGTVRLKLVKPCTRCSVPNVDPENAETSPAVAALLAETRADPRMGGAVTFGMNAIVLEGIDCTLAPGQAVRATFRF